MKSINYTICANILYATPLIETFKYLDAHVGGVADVSEVGTPGRLVQFVRVPDEGVPKGRHSSNTLNLVAIILYVKSCFIYYFCRYFYRYFRNYC